VQVACKSCAAAAVHTTVVRPFLGRVMHLVCSDVEIKTMYTPKTRPPVSMYYTKESRNLAQSIRVTITWLAGTERFSPG